MKALLWLEWKKSKSAYSIVLAIYVIVSLFLYFFVKPIDFLELTLLQAGISQSNKMANIVIAAGGFLVITFMPFLFIVIYTIRGWSKELRKDSRFMIFSVPRSMTQYVLAKVMYLLGILIIGISLNDVVLTAISKEIVINIPFDTPFLSRKDIVSTIIWNGSYMLSVLSFITMAWCVITFTTFVFKVNRLKSLVNFLLILGLFIMENIVDSITQSSTLSSSFLDAFVMVVSLYGTIYMLEEKMDL